MNTKATSVFKDPDVAETLFTIHDKHVVLPAYKYPNNIILICKKHYIDCLKTELGLDSSQGDPTYTVTTLSKEEMIDNHMPILSSFGLSMKDEDYNLSKITQVSIQITLYRRGCQVFYQASF